MLTIWCALLASGLFVYMRYFFALCLFCFLCGCDSAWNNPYVGNNYDNVLYSSFAEPPKHFDPARSYSADEYSIITQIYEPPLQYHFLRRPYELVTLAATTMPVAVYLDADGRELAADAADELIVHTRYVVQIQHGIRYQPHPAFARDGSGWRYHGSAADLSGAERRIADFEYSASRELLAEDYVYQIKRLAHPGLHSPIASIMATHIVGFSEFTERLAGLGGEAADYALLRASEMTGVRALDRYRYEIMLNGKYPQFLYWLALPFFAPMPWEADVFYSYPERVAHNITLDVYPVGTGAFMLVENNPNAIMRLARNPLFRGESYPSEGEPSDVEAGWLADAGATIPFLDGAIYTLEKESIPEWGKFLQGYYDLSGVSSDNFGRAVQVRSDGVGIGSELSHLGISLATTPTPSVFYVAFNMVDQVVGGLHERGRALRQAISIALDFEEFIAIFRNGRGQVAHAPVPPGIFGHRADGINPATHRLLAGTVQRRPLSDAINLMSVAGYEGGIDPATGKPLVLYFDTAITGPDGRATLNWLVKQFKKLNIQLVVRATDYNRFRGKLRVGDAQIFMFGWNADYPDPENFMFLLYGDNAKLPHGGENSANYISPEFDQLFVRMRTMDSGPERQHIIDGMYDILRNDAPWIFGFFPVSYSLYHSWYGNAKPHPMANNTLKYKRIDGSMRSDKRRQWNQPRWHGLAAVVAGLMVLLALLVRYMQLRRAREVLR